LTLSRPSYTLGGGSLGQAEAAEDRKLILGSGAVADKVSRLAVLLQTLARLPGLGFLAQADTQMREAVDQVDEIGDSIEEVKRNTAEARNAAREVVRGEDDE
jgi:hypothetical protein